MEQLGQPIAYLVVKEGTPVYDRNRDRVGVVEHVLADEREDIFHGLIVHTLPLPGRHLYADANQVAELRERGVVLAAGPDDLHDPREKPPGRAGTGRVESPVQAGLRRAWDWLSEDH